MKVSVLRLIELYEQYESCSAVAQIVGVSTSTVQYRLKGLVEMNPKGWLRKTCILCPKETNGRRRCKLHHRLHVAKLALARYYRKKERRKNGTKGTPGRPRRSNV